MKDLRLYYILDENGEPEPTYDLHKWADWMETSTKDGSRFIKQENIGNYRISTVFLGLDHAFSEEIPVLWETMIFNKTDDNDPNDQTQWRCGGSSEQAMAQHEFAVGYVKHITKESANAPQNPDFNREIQNPTGDSRKNRKG